MQQMISADFHVYLHPIQIIIVFVKRHTFLFCYFHALVARCLLWDAKRVAKTWKHVG